MLKSRRKAFDYKNASTQFGCIHKNVLQFYGCADAQHVTKTTQWATVRVGGGGRDTQMWLIYDKTDFNFRHRTTAV